MTASPRAPRPPARRTARPARPRRPWGPRAAAALLLAAAVAATGGCGLRLETPPPPTPTPDAVELVRDATARDAVALAELATAAAEGEPVELAAVLVGVAEASQAHATALGGVYEMFPDGASPAPSPAPSPSPSPAGPSAPATPPPTPDAAAVLARLDEAAAAAARDADAVADGDLARLLAAVAVSRGLLAEQLAAATGGSRQPRELTVPEQLPAGLAPDAAAAVVQSEDALGMVWEVVAARSAEPARTAAAERAVLHRERAQAWAEAAGLAGTADDPRASAYGLPAELTGATVTPEAAVAVAEGLEADLAVVYATLVADAAPGERGPLLDAVAEQVRRAVAAGAPVPAFPGLPERA